MDLTETRYATFERLREYCYRVAGTVGLTCLHVFGFDDPHAPELAERLGIAFQLTNILRDVGGDLALGRVYLPGGRSGALRLLGRGTRARRGHAVGARTAALRGRTRLAVSTPRAPPAALRASR